MYTILRHGGNRNHKWKAIYATDDKAMALQRYDMEYQKMRQGGIRLLKDGETIKWDWAPRCRTRW